MKKLRLLSKLFGLALAVLVTTSCDPITNAVDCAGICNRYGSCFDSNYDSSACQSRCRENANNQGAYEDRVEACVACMDDRSCTSATFACGALCSGIVP